MALALGFAHPDHLLAALDSRQISEWIAYAGIEPFGELRADFRAGQIAATVANVHRGNKTDPYHADNFFISLGDGKPKDQPVLLDDPEEQAKLVRTIFRG